MDNAFRILTIYNRLLQNKSINKQSLKLELDKSPRMILETSYMKVNHG
ncbi:MULTISPECIES: hypothetical protein [Staphylococcus]|uniref:Uncharacterized protein n=1 Tax=Staphylococcus saprophyticus TaxID=29385 RepID=B2DCM4_STASA|nr:MULTISPECIES: hypothetical protein [Staphylococcus]MCD9063432.1 hypothetical protein [Staphylococcus saprophyticus]MDW3915299.1 hypothetical protein [Staphylococcus saprophyticus]MDW4010515.1 hypothetical protein [Staphylococcus saprophyticus]MDW4285478.1 hypothetical protein [Staphylococcus saprophyticus]BAG24383.1 unnamed protein product [Staphylococcus saprophyticus]